MKTRHTSLFIILLLLQLGLSGCATLQPPGTGGPRAADYPPLYETDDARRSLTTSAITRLLPTTTGHETPPALSPLTLTVENVPLANRQPTFLPKLGSEAQMSEEETRESLRRFIRDWRDLIGADPAKLSLVDRADLPDGVKVARYEQRPFRYPIRGNFGKLEISFTADRRLVNISSTCIPDADRIQTALAAIAVKLKSEDAVNQIVNGAVTFTSPSGTQQNVKLSASQLVPRELVTFVQQSANNPKALEFRIAWEVEVTGASVKRVYVDAVNGELIPSQ